MKSPLRLAFALLLVYGTAAAAPGDAIADDKENDFPTEARAEFVYGCMVANGQTPEMLRKCSCSIDYIASVIPYEKYIQMETTIRLQQIPGERGGLYRGNSWAKSLVEELNNAQAESTLKCF